MASELGARERRYVEAYLELEAQASAPPAGTRERVLAAALAEATQARRSAPPRTSRSGVLLLGVGLCAAAVAMAWWLGRVSVIEEHAMRVQDQAPLVTHGDRPVHEASAAGRRGAADPGRETMDATMPDAAEPAEELRPSTLPAASTERGKAAVPSRHRSEPAPTPAPTRSHAEPEDHAPTLSDAEVALLERARRLAQRGEHRAALAVLREHEASYPRSVLGRERTAEQVAVLCRMGAASAESARASFMAGDPPQYLRSRVEKACAQ